MNKIKFFNTAGPVSPDKHYTIPPLSRLDLANILMLINQEKYFVLHAPRQTGKTSTLLPLMAKLNKEDEYNCLYSYIEAAQTARGNVETGIKTVVSQIAARAKTYLDDNRLRKWATEALADAGGQGALTNLLETWCNYSPQKRSRSIYGACKK